MIEDYFRFTTVEPKTASQPYIVNYETNMNVNDITFSAIAEADPENTVSVINASITNNMLYIITSPFTPDFDFTLTVSAEIDGETIDTKTFEILANNQKGTTKKSDEQLITEWTTKLSK